MSSGAGTSNGLIVQAGSVGPVSLCAAQIPIYYPRGFSSIFALIVTAAVIYTPDAHAIATAYVQTFGYFAAEVSVGGGAPGSIGNIFWLALGS